MLGDAAITGRTGVLQVDGDPGGEFRLCGGDVVDVRSAGTPTVIDLLTRPSPIPLGDHAIRLLARMAALDGAFAIAAGRIDGYRWSPESCCGGRDPAGRPAVAIDPIALFAETERRLRAVAPARLSPHRDVLCLTSSGAIGSAADAHPDALQVLRWTNGSRTCRDIAFQLRRGLFAVTVCVCVLLADGLLAVRQARRAGSTPAALPRRSRGDSGINDMLPPRPAPAAPPADLRAALPRKPLPDKAAQERAERTPKKVKES
ncbi:MAG: hypothetical protein HOQ24_01055 [Mycobacteriaceae bacterium]|nr:hypothetical protein [Mycobacteriaceae bacterium]